MIDGALQDVAGVDPLSMQTPDKRAALTALTRVVSRVEELRLRDDGLLLCSWHHHRAHDHRYDHHRLPTGDVRFVRWT